MPEIGQEAQLEVREGLGSPAGGSGGVGRPIRRSGRCRGPPRGLGGVGRVNLGAGRLLEFVPKVRDWLRGPSGGL